MNVMEWIFNRPFQPKEEMKEDWIKIRFDPQPNITLWELAQVVGGIGGLRYGVIGRRTELEKLGTAKRHFVEIPEKK